jgi:hypothetical protein
MFRCGLVRTNACLVMFPDSLRQIEAETR